MIRVTQAQTLQFGLQKNYLAADKAPDLETLVHSLVGLPAAEVTTPTLASWARLATFSDAYQAATLIEALLMQKTPYLVAVDQVATWYAATARQRNHALNSEFRLWGLATNAPIEELATLITGVIGNDPATVDTITVRLPAERIHTLTQTSRGGRVSETTTVDLALRWLRARGILATRRIDAAVYYAPLQHWYPGLDLAVLPDEAIAQADLVRAYLAAFGPATEADISAWTGFGKSETARAVNTLRSETTLTLIEGMPGMSLMLKHQAEAIQAVTPPSDPIINVLPANDPLTTAHRASRMRYVANPKLQRQVFRSSGAAKPTVLVNGQIVGLWVHRDSGIMWQPLTDDATAMQADIQHHLEQLATFVQPGTPVVLSYQA